MPHFSDQSPVVVEEITRTDQLEALVPQWWELFDRDSSATPFQSPAWLLPWWRHIGEGQLLTLAMRTRRSINGSHPLIGLLPLYIYRQPSTSSRDLLPLGVATTDYLDGLFASGWAARAVHAAFEHLKSRRKAWDVIDFRQLRHGSALLRARAPEDFADSLAEDECCPTLELPHTIEEFHAFASPHLLHNLHYYRKRADKIGGLCFEQAERKNLDEIFSQLLELHRARWLTRGEDGCLNNPAVQGMHREALPQLLEHDLLRLYVMKLDNQIIGVLYGLIDSPRRPQRSFYYYLAGFNPQFDRISPGTLLIAHAVEQCIGEGIRSFDFLRGQEAYKQLWGAQDRKTYRRTIRQRDTDSPSQSAVALRSPVESTLATKSKEEVNV